MEQHARYPSTMDSLAPKPTGNEKDATMRLVADVFTTETLLENSPLP